MSEKPVNLNRFRKARAKAAKQARADENAVRYGRPRSERDLARARADKSARDLDGHQREP